MHKTYSDTYQIPGFTGGYWAYALNTNETAGVPCSGPAPETIPKSHRRLGVYYLGWDSIEVAKSGCMVTKCGQLLTEFSCTKMGPRRQPFPRRSKSCSHISDQDQVLSTRCFANINNALHKHGRDTLYKLKAQACGI